MRRIKTFFRLPSDQRRLLISAALLVLRIRIFLWTLPFKTVRSLLSRQLRELDEPNEADLRSIKKIVRAVRRVSRYVPGATCLTQSLAAHSLLNRAGQPSVIRIGVAKSAKGGLLAHAWIEIDGRVVIGWTEDLHRYTPLTHQEENSLERNSWDLLY
jgi:hypothetical protein